jgi:hypothetical protein
MRSLDVIANSAGLTDFNPDLRDALVRTSIPQFTCQIFCASAITRD